MSMDFATTHRNIDVYKIRFGGSLLLAVLPRVITSMHICYFGSNYVYISVTSFEHLGISLEM